MVLVFSPPWIGRYCSYKYVITGDSTVRVHRILAHPEVSDEPEEETTPPQALGTASSTTPATANAQEEGKYDMARHKQQGNSTGTCR